MSTPAAKRRRADAASAVLRKPFHSPVIRRPDDADTGGKAPSKTPDARSPADAGAYSPSSPSVAARPPRPQTQTLRPTRSLGALSRAPSPRFRTPVRHGAAKRKRSPAAGTAPPAADDGEGEGDGPGSALLALVRAHGRAAARDATALRDLDGRLETARQARRIEGAAAAAAASPPGAPVDQELRELVARWRGAARTAAEELFEEVRERVDNAGGPKAWKEMRQRQLDFYQGFDGESPSRKKPVGGGLEEELEGDDEDDAAEHRLARGGEAKDDEREEDGEPEFNLAQMLRSLNIDLSLLGYDEEEEKWID